MCITIVRSDSWDLRASPAHLVAIREGLSAVVLVEGQLALQALAALALKTPLLVDSPLGVSVVYEVLVQAVALRRDSVKLHHRETHACAMPCHSAE